MGESGAGSSGLRVSALPLASIEVDGSTMVYRHQAPFRMRLGLFVRAWGLFGAILLIPLLALVTMPRGQPKPWGLLIGIPVLLPLMPRLLRSCSSVDATIDRVTGTLTLCSRHVGIPSTETISVGSITGLRVTKKTGRPRILLLGPMVLVYYLYSLEPTATITLVTSDGKERALFECMLDEDAFRVRQQVLSELAAFLGAPIVEV